MKTLLMAAMITASTSTAFAHPQLLCTPTKDYPGHWFQRMELNQEGTEIATDMYDVEGKVILTVEGRSEVEGVDRINGLVMYRTGQDCAGGCGEWSYKLEVNPEQDQGTNAMLHMTLRSYDESSGLTTERTTPYSYSCVYLK